MAIRDSAVFLSTYLDSGGRATFRGACDRAGLNPYLCEMVSLREQVSWVHTDKKAATDKAKAMVASSVERVIHNEPLDRMYVPIYPDTLVVGGGIAGIQAALEIAGSGKKVYLVEREPSIGGHMAQFDKTFPTLDCAACILTPRMVEAGTKCSSARWEKIVFPCISSTRIVPLPSLFASCGGSDFE